MNILTFGEPLLINYLSTSKIESNCESFFSLGGSEINTGIALSSLNNNVYLLSVFPNNELGNGFIEILKEKGIKTDYIMKSAEDLIGSMYVKDNSVIYQRKHSAFSFIRNIELDSIFLTNYAWIHLTGITPSLNNNCRIEWEKIINKSLDLKIPVSLDLNYRPGLCKLCDLWNIVKLYVNRVELLVLSRKDMIEICQIENLKDTFTIENMMLKLVDKLNIRRLVICIKDILEDKSQNRYSLMVFKNVLYKSKKKNHKPKEYIGGGDAYIASLIDGILKQKKDILDEADTYTIINQEKKGNFV